MHRELTAILAQNLPQMEEVLSLIHISAPWLKENLMNPNIDFLGICQLLKALRTVGFSENEIKKIARRIAVELGANFTLYA